MKLATPIAIRLVLASVAILCPFQCQFNVVCLADDTIVIDPGSHCDGHDHDHDSHQAPPCCPDGCSGHDCICGGALLPPIVDGGLNFPIALFETRLLADYLILPGPRSDLTVKIRYRRSPVGPAGDDMRIALSCWTI